MVIGSGMIAGRFAAYTGRKDFLVFASGVSDSSCSQPNEYLREERLLQEAIQHHRDATLVYFSTCSIYDPSLQQSPYVLHKLRMEALIRNDAAAFTIFRVSNPVGSTTNRHTVLNYFVDQIQQEALFQVWAYASRNLIDLDDMYVLCDAFLQLPAAKKTTVNIANPVNYPVTDIIESIEKHLGKKGNYILAEKGNSPMIDTSKIQPLFSQLKLDFSHNYLANLLKKYFPV